MVIIELIGSISLVFVLISAILLIIIHIKNKQDPITIIHDQQLNNNKQTDVNMKNDEIVLSSPIKYDIQWTKSSVQSEMIDSSSKNVLESSEFEQGDSLSFTDQSVRDTIEKSYQTIQNQLKVSYPYSISNLDVTIPSNISSSIDLEQFECTSTTSNLSEFLKD